MMNLPELQEGLRQHRVTDIVVATGLNPTTIYNVLGSNCNPTYKNMVKLEKFLIERGYTASPTHEQA